MLPALLPVVLWFFPSWYISSGLSAHYDFVLQGSDWPAPVPAHQHFPLWAKASGARDWRSTLSTFYCKLISRKINYMVW
jgi:hypothetical protein